MSHHPSTPSGSGSWRRQPLPRGWHKIRQRILHRDHGLCQEYDALFGICGQPATDVDHIDPDGPQADPSNLRSLCRPHHQLKSSREGAAAMLARKPRRLRAPEAHPGLKE